MPKGTSQAEIMSNSEKIKAVALAVVKLKCMRHTFHCCELCTKDRHSLWHCLKLIWVDPKACFYLTNTALSSSGEIEAIFG